MNKVAIYARYSSDLQSGASIEDQVRIVKEWASKNDWTVFECYEDHGISGATMERPAMRALLRDAKANKFDYVLAEALDRLSRDQEDIAAIYKRMEFANIKIMTLSEGEITNLHIGLKGTMNALQLKDIADKTRRGIRGRVEHGKSGGGITYGYEVAKKLSPAGEVLRGERNINDQQAAVVERIFQQYAEGKSPKAIAQQLNLESISGPAGKGWGASTINGNRERGTGILNNEIYIGVLVWNRLKYKKDPNTGRRVSRPNPQDQQIRKDVPELRIINQELWDKVKARQGALKKHKSFWEKRRPRNLFSFLLKCGCCGGGFSKISKTHYGCSAARNKGVCINRQTIRQNDLEVCVVHALEVHLMKPELCQAFCEEYTKHSNHLRMKRSSNKVSYEAELAKLGKGSERIIKAIYEGYNTPDMKIELERIASRRAELEKLLTDAKSDNATFLHPSMASRYQQAIQGLIKSLKDDEHRHEAADLLRGLIDKVVLTPDDQKKGLRVDLHGCLAGILSVATKETILENSDFIHSVELVTGSQEKAADRLPEKTKSCPRNQTNVIGISKA